MPGTGKGIAVGLTIADRVETSEHELFIGRTREREELAGALAEARDRPVAVYVYGPPGVGKSALLRRFTSACRDVCVARLDFGGPGGVDAAPDGVWLVKPPSVVLSIAVAGQPPDMAHLACELTPAGLGEIARAVNGLAGEGRPVLLLVDGYDALRAWDQEIREACFYPLGPGVCLLLSGRLSPEQLWLGDLAWRRQVRAVPLEGLSPEEARAFLGRGWRGELPPMEGILVWTAGRPRWLAALADAFAQWRSNPLAFGTGAHGQSLYLYLLERMLHPGSRRQEWRPGIGRSLLDKALAVACLFRTFDRRDLGTVMGCWLEEEHWQALVDLPFVGREGRRYGVRDEVRRVLAGFVRKERPWASRVWQWRAAGHRLRQMEKSLARGEGPGSHWLDVVELAWWAPCRRVFCPTLEAAEAWCVRHGTAGRGLPAGASQDAAAGSWLPWRDLPLTGGEPLVTVERGGSVLGTGVAIHQGDTVTIGLVIHAAVPPEPQGDAAGDQEQVTSLYGVLLRELASHWDGSSPLRLGTPVGPAAEVLEPLLGRLGLGHRPEEDLSGFSEPLRRRWRWWVLEPPPGGHRAWLKCSAEEPRPARSPAERRGWAAAAKEALEALDESLRLVTTRAARHFGRCFESDGSSPTADSVRRWLLDALWEADLGHQSGLRRTLLTLYYVDRIGSHEVVAERLDLPRPTYFRHHREALVHLGEALLTGPASLR